MSDFTSVENPTVSDVKVIAPVKAVSPKSAYFISKRLFDITISLALLPILAASMVFIVCLNPFLNRGPLFFIQKRMGRDCRPFNVIKLRTMTAAPAITRAADDPLELERITPMGHVMRKSRIDELPQILNVLAGEMSLIGPRPDAYEHALVYLDAVPGYRRRHTVRPGISGLAQTRVGYVQGIEATRRKVRADLAYVSRAGFRLDAAVAWHTLKTVMTRAGT